VTLPNFTSSTTATATAHAFGSVGTIFHLLLHGAVSIYAFSEYPDEQEWLLDVGSRVRVMAAHHATTGVERRIDFAVAALHACLPQELHNQMMEAGRDLDYDPHSIHRNDYEKARKKRQPLALLNSWHSEEAVHIRALSKGLFDLHKQGDQLNFGEGFKDCAYSIVVLCSPSLSKALHDGPRASAKGLPPVVHYSISDSPSSASDSGLLEVCALEQQVTAQPRTPTAGPTVLKAPPYWTSSTGSHLIESSQAKEMCQRIFIRTFNHPKRLQDKMFVISKVLHSENHSLWELYATCLQKMHQQRGSSCWPLAPPAQTSEFLDLQVANHLCLDVNEVFLFHGSSPQRPGSELSIVAEGFDLSLSAPTSPGVHFSECSWRANYYSSHGCGDFVMLLCRVLCGQANRIDFFKENAHDEVQSPPFRFDSVLWDRSTQLMYRDFSVYKTEQIYPEYIIYYTLR